MPLHIVVATVLLCFLLSLSQATSVQPFSPARLRLSCNCPGNEGCQNGFGVNCTKSQVCCSEYAYNPSCINPATSTCCRWGEAVTPCALGEGCCGSDVGPTGSAFCCAKTTTCCPTSGEGNSLCCRSDQVCCGGMFPTCCDAATQICDNSSSIPSPFCLRKTPIKPSPNRAAGTLQWGTMLYGGGPMLGGVLQPVSYNQTHLISTGIGASGHHRGLFFVHKLTGMATEIVITDDKHTAVSLSSSLPLVVNGKSVFLCNEMNATAVDVENLKLQWQNSAYSCLGYSIERHLVLSPKNDLIFFGGNGVRAASMSTGKQAYNIPSDSDTSPLQLTKDEEFLIFVNLGGGGGLNGNIVTANTGKVTLIPLNNCWVFNGDGIPAEAALLPQRNLVVFCGMLAVSLPAKTKQWEFKINNERGSCSAPSSVVASPFIAAVNGSHVLVVSAVSQTHDVLRWSASIPAHHIACLSVKCSKDGNTPLLIVSHENSGSTNYSAFDANTGKQIWSAQLDGAVSRPSEATCGQGGVLYVGRRFGSSYPAGVIALDLQSGQLLGEWGTGAAVSGRPLLEPKTEGMVFFGAGDMTLYGGNAFK